MTGRTLLFTIGELWHPGARDFYNRGDGSQGENSTVQCSTVQCSTVQYSTLKYSTAH
jgi:hypothetical protein